MIRRPASTITITAADVESLDELKKKLDEKNAQRTAMETLTNKESERDSFLNRTKELDQMSKNHERLQHAPSSSSDFLSKRRRMATEAASANQRRAATLERTGNVTQQTLKRARQT